MHRQGTRSNNPLCVDRGAERLRGRYKYEGFLTTAIQTDMMHGKLSPRIAIITDVSGIFAFQPTVTYRVSDNFLLSATYSAIATTPEDGPRDVPRARHGAAARDRAAELSGSVPGCGPGSLSGAAGSVTGATRPSARSSAAVAGVEVEGEDDVVDGEGEGGVTSQRGTGSEMRGSA